MNKLNPPVWLLWWKRLKFWLLSARPIPLIYRHTCKKCRSVFSVENSRRCPHCNHIEYGAIYIVCNANGGVEGCYKKRIDAEDLRELLSDEGTFTYIEEHEIL